MKLEITVEQLNELLNYLADKPYYQVADLISLLLTLPKIEEKTISKGGKK